MVDHDFIHNWLECGAAMPELGFLQRTSKLLRTAGWHGICGVRSGYPAARVLLHFTVTFSGLLMPGNTARNDNKPSRVVRT
jgi:hypothetical protein